MKLSGGQGSPRFSEAHAPPAVTPLPYAHNPANHRQPNPAVGRHPIGPHRFVHRFVQECVA
jgi:hypothetical protein